LECDYRQDEIEEDTCAKRYEQKNAETTKPAICHDPMKLPENSPADKRFPHDFDSFHPGPQFVTFLCDRQANPVRT
jgi:hypothetical protein